MKSPGRRGVTAIDKYIGLRLRTRRLILHMTQTDLAKVIGVTFQQLQKYEKGTNRITASTLQKLAAGMKVPITYFFEDAPCENADRNETEMAWTRFVATPDGLALFRAFRLIESKSLRRAVVNLVEGMGKEPTIISPSGRQCDRPETAASRLRSRSSLDAFTMAPDAEMAEDQWRERTRSATGGQIA